MGEFFLDMVGDLFSASSSFMDRFLAFVMLLVFISLFGIIGFLFYIGINEIGIKETKSTITTIENKGILPAHTTTTYIMVGKVMVPNTVHHPESYWIYFDIEEQQCKESLTYSFFSELKKGDRIKVGYGKGRLNQAIFPKSISRLE